MYYGLNLLVFKPNTNKMQVVNNIKSYSTIIAKKDNYHAKEIKHLSEL